MEQHDNMNLVIAQGMENNIIETNHEFGRATNMHWHRGTEKGTITRSMVGQNMSRSLQLARHRAALLP
jgi:hypothetical protein